MPREYNFGTLKTIVEEDNSGNVSVKNVDSLSTVEGQFTGETLIRGRLEANSETISAGTWADIADTNSFPPSNEFDGTNINLDKTGWYEVEATVPVFGAAAGDEIQVALRDVDAGSIVPGSQSLTAMAASRDDAGIANSTVFLNADTNYRVQAKDVDNSFSINGGAYGDVTAYFALKWSPVQPD